jgi:hypothetical protein
VLFAQPGIRVTAFRLIHVTRTTAPSSPWRSETEGSPSVSLRSSLPNSANAGPREDDERLAVPLPWPPSRIPYNRRTAHRSHRLGTTRHERQVALTHLLSKVSAAVLAKGTGYSRAIRSGPAAHAGTDWASFVASRTAAAK